MHSQRLLQWVQWLEVLVRCMEISLEASMQVEGIEREIQRARRSGDDGVVMLWWSTGPNQSGL